MPPDLSRFLDQANVDLTFLFSGKLLEADRGRQPGRAATDDNDIVFHGFSLHLAPRVRSLLSGI